MLAACNPNRKLTRLIPPAVITDSVKTASLPIKDNSQTDAFMLQLLQRYPEYFDSLITNKDSLQLQIIYTQVDRTKNRAAKFTDHYFNLNPEQYFYPASTVKFPIALLALQKLNELNIPGVDKNTTMITEAGYPGQTAVYNDPNSADGRPTIANYIKKIFLVSDNDAFNRLYEFLGQEYINENLHQMGYKDAQILHRLNISLTEDENRHTNPVRFIDSTGKTLYEQPAAFSQMEYAERDTRLGKGYMQGNELVNEPFDFSKKNRLSLSDLHSILKSVMFPEAVAEKQRFDLTEDDYAFVRKYMSMFPSESTFPPY
ncbi:MAG: serine hydrolase, partial [Bacteroidetes bacterium]|nr:serine hydrolase [Bacteroidota bacterium]